MHITQLLENKGYKKYRCIYEKGKFIYKENFMNGFSSMVNGGLEIFYVKDKDFENPIIYGLHEKQSPPTLIKPRPFIRLKRVNKKSGIKETITQDFDDAMNICLLKENAEKIFKGIFNHSLKFHYDLTKNN